MFVYAMSMLSRSSTLVGARAVKGGWVGLSGRPGWGAASCRLHDAWAVSPHPTGDQKGTQPTYPTALAPTESRIEA
jgi:hypothetical protein